MSKLLLASAALAMFVAVPTQAAVMDPVAYAEDYCALRRGGRSVDEAMETAVTRNLDHSRIATVLSNGRDLDVVLSGEGVRLLCPDLL